MSRDITISAGAFVRGCTHAIRSPTFLRKHLLESEGYLEHLRSTTRSCKMHSSAGISAHVQVSLDFVQEFYALNMTLVAYFLAKRLTFDCKGGIRLVDDRHG